jgi:hypothetical protein
MGQAALLPLQRIGQFEDPRSAIGPVGELNQHVEVGQRQAGLGVELPIESRHQASVHGEEAAPSALLLVVEPPRFRHSTSLPPS